MVRECFWHWRLDRKSWASDMVWGAGGGAAGSFAQFEPVSPGWQVLLRADLWYNRGGRRGPSGLTQERKTTRWSLLRQLLLFCLLLAPQLLIDDNLNIVLKGTQSIDQNIINYNILKIYLWMKVYLFFCTLLFLFVSIFLVDSSSFHLKSSSMPH